ncbi:helix-turn-helix domain-containing protein [Brucella intermedia GD04153]|uniref:Helix-turn-helix domain-containing protein n=1 Tax=Brucella intermedia GD04153 TaxID=2975438 RepID=A0AA42H7N8_9HYPH|nr:helix-turn-helix domain-containing protein [Brucella intermedia]MDH0127108.1 helix-turn-helix domain-containing protein [Brucella intermedia GD04153]RRD21398.1 helix-turn-helix domain-containing protein [Brucellaceae bacterium VT-16-1752]
MSRIGSGRNGAVNDLELQGRDTLRTANQLSEALHANLMDWQVRPISRAGPIAARVRSGSVGQIRMIELSGEPFHGTRGRSEIATDGADFLGVLLQRSGTTHCQVGDVNTLVGPGDISLWYSGRPVEFHMPGPFQKLCMLIPVRCLEPVLQNPTSYEGVHLAAGNPLAALLGSYLTTLSDQVAGGQEDTASATADVTLELLAAAFRANAGKDHATPRKKLQNRVLQYIEARLSDPELTPAAIAKANGISPRYLYLLFETQGASVAGWIRQRRLARCRAALENQDDDQTVCEIAHSWGFSDAAHFSRLFKSAYGASPMSFKAPRKS